MIKILHDHPLIGSITAATSLGASFFNAVNPLLQCILLILGIVVAGITIYEKYKGKSHIS